MKSKTKIYACIECGKEITEEDYDIQEGLCDKCYEIETDEIYCEDNC
jgi:hypothetical protein